MKKELLTYEDPKSPVSEIFRTLRTNIQFMNTDRKLKTLLLTSTFPGEGKSWITANLAVTFAQAGKRVVLIDADMRKGRQYSIFGVLPKPGLSNYLSNIGVDEMENSEDVNIAKYIQETDIENLHILTAGNVPPNPSELLVSRRMKNLLQELKTMCDLVIIDGTPCDLVTDAIILSRIVDSTMIITAKKETKKDSLVRIVKNIQNVGGRIAGVVVNKMDVSSKKYNQSYYYGSISGNNMKKKSKKESKKIEEYFTSFFNNREKENFEVSNDIDFLDEENDKTMSFEPLKTHEINNSNEVVDNKFENKKIDFKEEYTEYIENEDNLASEFDNKKEQPNSKVEEEKEYKKEFESEQILENDVTDEVPKSFKSEDYNYTAEDNYKEPQFNYNSKEEYKEPQFDSSSKIEYKEPELDYNSKVEYKEPYSSFKKKNKNKFKNKKHNNHNKGFKTNYSDENFNENSIYNNYNKNEKKYQEIEAHVQGEGRISEVKIDQNMDEKTKEILRQVNEYIESEKRRQGEKY